MERYITLDYLYFWFNSEQNALRCKLERATGDNPDTWETVEDNVIVSAWPGPAMIKSDNARFGGRNNQSSQYWNYRLTVMSCAADGSDSDLASGYLTDKHYVSIVRGYGTHNWYPFPNNLMQVDHMYSTDYQKNVTFPATVKATTITATGTLNIPGGKIWIKSTT